MNAPAPALSAAAVGHAIDHLGAGQRVVDVLMEQHGVSEAEALRSVASYGGYLWLTPQDLSDLEPDFEKLPLTKASQRSCILLRERTQSGARLAVISDPSDLAQSDWVLARAGSAVEFAVATKGDIQAYLARHESTVKAMESVQFEDQSEHLSYEDEGERISLSLIAEDASPIVRIVNSTIYDALKSGASDVHLETGPRGMEIKYRIDGVLESISKVPGLGVAEQVISRVKVLAELDIAERRVPQDGRIKISVNGRSVDLRVSIMPSIYGEDAVLRVLDKRNMVPDGDRLTLEILGFAPSVLETVRRLAHAPHGMLLVTGPTGSGKTTTLYAALSEINNGRDKIITIEDPVEYELPGILQIPVNEKKGLTFARGLRSILRHDPDRIMVGEIRDPETAEIAVQSALTGHLVVTTVHANNVYDVFGRFLHMGVDLHVLTSALNGIWAQRLIRTVCTRCAVPHELSSDEMSLMGLPEEDAALLAIRRGVGCGECRGSGYRGRKAIAEVLVMTDRLRALISEQAPLVQIKEEGRRGGTKSLRSSAIELLKAGLTSVEEVDRVTLQDG